MTRLNFALLVLWTVASVGFCQEDDDEPVIDITDKDIVKGVVEVCAGATSSKVAMLFTVKL